MLAGAVAVAAVAGAAMALIHAFLVVTLRANQIVSGLALTIFAGAAGLSSYLGNDLNLADQPATHQFTAFLPAGWRDAPVIGPILLDQNALVYASWALVAIVILYLGRTRPGLNVRAVGESPDAADAMGINVAAYRYAHTLAGGALAGVGGATFSLALTPQWVDGLTQGAGWIAIALVIFAFWRPGAVPRRRVLLRRLLGTAVHAPGAGRHRRAGALPGASVRDDDRRARRRVVGRRPPSARGAGGPRPALRARGPLRRPFVARSGRARPRTSR